MQLIYSPTEILHNHLSFISLGMTVMLRRNWKQWLCIILFFFFFGGGGGNVPYGVCENGEYRFALLLKIGFVTLDPLRDSDKLCILLKGFVQGTCVSDMKIVHKICRDRF